MNGKVMFLDLVKGEAREITQREAALMAMEFAKRCTYQDGVCYVDCKPPRKEGS